MKILIAALALAGAVTTTFAHDAWISRNALRNHAGEWCCGEGDCGIIDHGAVKLRPSGYEVNGLMTIGDGARAIRVELHEFISFEDTQPSPDGEYWLCRRANGSRRCFFAPPPTD